MLEIRAPRGAKSTISPTLIQRDPQGKRTALLLPTLMQRDSGIDGEDEDCYTPETHREKPKNTQ